MSTLSPADISLLGAIAHEKIDQIVSLPFEPEMLESEVAQAVARGAITLHSMGRNINLLQLMSVVGQRVSPSDWLPVSKIFSNGYGNVDAELAVGAVRAAYKVRRTADVMAEMQENMVEHPAEVETWLPELQEQLRQLNETGEIYDPRPSTIYQDETPEVLFTLGNRELNNVLRGGVRSGMFGVFCGVSGQGKSTSLYTLAVETLLVGRTVDFFNNERTRRVVLDRILRGVTQLSEVEIATRQGSTPERQQALSSWLRVLDERLRIYIAEHYKTTTMGRNIKNDKPDIVLVDYLRPMEGMLPGGGRHDDPTGDMAYWMMEAASTYQVTLLTACQMSDEAAKKFRADSAAVPQIAYGSARPFHAANLWIGVKRDEIENYGYMRVAKDNIANQFDTEHHLPFDPRLWIYVSERPGQSVTSLV